MFSAAASIFVVEVAVRGWVVLSIVSFNCMCVGVCMSAVGDHPMGPAADPTARVLSALVQVAAKGHQVAICLAMCVLGVPQLHLVTPAAAAAGAGAGWVADTSRIWHTLSEKHRKYSTLWAAARVVPPVVWCKIKFEWSDDFGCACQQCCCS
jgi:hypothetical protein